jgi:hypothetical protein
MLPDHTSLLSSLGLHPVRPEPLAPRGLMPHDAEMSADDIRRAYASSPAPEDFSSIPNL